MSFRVLISSLLLAPALLFISACTAPTAVTMTPGFEPTSYKAVVIPNPDDRITMERFNWLELPLASCFEGMGYQVVGEKQIDEFSNGELLSIRYTGYGGSVPRISILIEDAVTGRTLCRVFASETGWDHAAACRNTEAELLSQIKRVMSGVAVTQ